MDNLENREDQVQEQAPAQEKQVQYYADGRFSNDPDTTAANAAAKPHKKPLPTWAKALLIIGAVILVIVFLTTGCNKLVNDFKDEFKGTDTTEVETNFGHDYIGVVHVEGEINEDGTDTYNHAYILNSIDAMMNDSENKGMIL